MALNYSTLWAVFRADDIEVQKCTNKYKGKVQTFAIQEPKVNVPSSCQVLLKYQGKTSFIVSKLSPLKQATAFKV